MSDFKVGDIVTRKSYGGDITFIIADIRNEEGGKPVYVLKGILYRIEADSRADDLIPLNPKTANISMQRSITGIKKQISKKRTSGLEFFLNRFRSVPGKVLHIDSSGDFLDICIKHYRKAGLKVSGQLANESEQPSKVSQLLQQYRPDILVVTGHDAIKKDSNQLYSIDSYRNSKYYIQSVIEARKYEADPDRLCIFAGACQSYFEAIMDAGANFASSPGRILINALDPAFVAEKVALTDSRKVVSAQDISLLTISGKKGIGGINTKGRLIRV